MRRNTTAPTADETRYQAEPRRAQTTLSSKFILSFLMVNLLAISAVAMVVNFTTSRALSEQAGADLHNLASSEGLAVGALLQHQVELLQTLSVNEIFIHRAELANSQYEENAGAVLADLLAQEVIWQSAVETDRIVQLVLTNSSANELIAFQRRFPDHFEMLITDRSGATLAATNLTQHYFHANEDWWQAAFAGSVFIGSDADVNPDHPHLVVAVPLLAPDGQSIIGVLRSSYKATAIAERLAVGVQANRHQNLSLVLPQDHTVFTALPQLALADGTTRPTTQTQIDAHIVANLQVNTFQHIALNDVPMLGSLAPVQTLEGSPALADLNWYILATQDREFALASVTAQQRTIWLVAAVMMIAATFSAVVTAKRLTTPIVRLTETAQRIRDGYLEIEADVDSNDEIGVLANTFNSMTGRLRHSIAQLEEHRDQLEERVAKRTAELARQSQMWDVILSTTPNFFFIFDVDGSIIYASPPAQAAMKLALADVIGRSWQTLPLPLPPHLQRDLEQVFASGRQLHNEYNIVIDEDPRTYEYTLNPVVQNDAAVTSIVATVRDVTEQKAARENLLHSQKMESLGVLAGGVAHDFNNLLVAMLSQTALAASLLPPDNPAREHIEKATTAANRAADLTRQLLAYSGRATLVMKPIKLTELIEESLHLFEIGIPKQVRLEIDAAADLPCIVGDQGQIQQIIMNLILNAAEAIGEHPGYISIKVDTIDLELSDENYWQLTKDPLLPGRYVRLIVADTGTGMDNETLQNIFDPFFTTKFTGRGLGLAAVLGIVRGHLGGLKVLSEVGRGTTFELIFPEGTAELPPKAPAAAPGPLDTSATVLVVDDEAPVREAVVDILSLAGLKTITAQDGQTALSIYETQGAEIDLVLLDLSMPGLSGQQTYQALRALNPKAKILLSSGYSETEITRQFDNHDPIEFLPKPYDMVMLVAKVTEQLGHLRSPVPGSNGG